MINYGHEQMINLDIQGVQRIIFKLDENELGLGVASAWQVDITNSYRLLKPMLRTGLQAEIETRTEEYITWKLTDKEITLMRAGIDFFEFYITQ